MMLLLFIPCISFSQNINKVDDFGRKQGVWQKNYQDGGVRYKGVFKDDVPIGVFHYYYHSGELQAEKEFFQRRKKFSITAFNSNMYIYVWGILTKRLITQMIRQT